MNKNDVEQLLNNNKSNNYQRIGSFIVTVLIVHFGFFGLICNHLLYDTTPQIIWFYQLYTKIYSGILIALLLFLGGFLTFIEEISIIGIKQTLKLGFVIIIFSILWYWEEFGVSFTPFLLIFSKIEGYVNTFLLFTILLCGSLIGRKFKQYSLLKRRIIQFKSLQTNKLV